MNSSNVHELGLKSLVYVSRSCLALDGDAEAIAEIVRTAISRNAALRVTGALIYTELYFAQVLEGPSRAVDELMGAVRHDKRHMDVTVVAEQKLSTRKFENWAMAYGGPSPHLDRFVKPLISPVTSIVQRLSLVDRLMTFMQPQGTQERQLL